MTNLITEARELCEKATKGPWEAGIYGAVCLKSGFKLGNIEGTGNAAFIARSRTIIPELCDALEKAEEQGQGCEHCQGWDTRSGAQYCPMCGKKLPVYAGTIGGEIVQHAMKELGAEEGTEK